MQGIATFIFFLLLFYRTLLYRFLFKRKRLRYKVRLSRALLFFRSFQRLLRLKRRFFKRRRVRRSTRMFRFFNTNQILRIGVQRFLKFQSKIVIYNLSIM